MNTLTKTEAIGYLKGRLFEAWRVARGERFVEEAIWTVQSSEKEHWAVSELKELVSPDRLFVR